MDNNIEEENNLEKSSRNKNDIPFFLVIGAVMESITPGAGALNLLGASVFATYATKPITEYNDYKTPLKEMPLYAIKNSARCLIGATAVSMWKYFT